MLSFCREKKKNKININRTILHHPRIDDIVLATYADTYLAHAVPGQAVVRPEDALVHHAAPPNRLDEQKVIVGRFLSLIREFNTMAEKIELKKTEIELQRGLIWEIDTYTSLDLTCEDDYFLEALSSNLRGAVVSFQAWVKKVENSKKTILVNKLNKLKADMLSNFEQISIIESELNGIIDKEILLKVKSMK
jgi:hypothetical protein